jgi:hypothetical protein
VDGAGEARIRGARPKAQHVLDREDDNRDGFERFEQPWCRRAIATSV